MADVYGGASSSDCDPADRHLTRRLDWRVRRPGGSGCRAVPPVLRASVVRDFGLELTFISPQDFYDDTVEVDPKEAKAANADYSVSLDLSAARRSR